MITCLFLTFLVLLLLGVPISLVMILASTLAILGFSQYSLDVISQKLFSQSNSFPLMAIPFFVFAGGVMSKGGMSARLIRLASSIVGNVRGGLAMVSIVACMFFASISGSTAATNAAIGMVMMPAVVKTGFSKGSSTALHACAGSVGIIIPPSIPLILMGIIGGISIRRTVHWRDYPRNRDWPGADDRHFLDCKNPGPPAFGRTRSNSQYPESLR